MCSVFSTSEHGYILTGTAFSRRVLYAVYIAFSKDEFSRKKCTESIVEDIAQCCQL